jgi:hypothetical protein
MMDMSTPNLVGKLNLLCVLINFGFTVWMRIVIYFPLSVRITERAHREYGPAVATFVALPLALFALFIAWQFLILVAGIHREAMEQFFQSKKRSPSQAADANANDDDDNNNDDDDDVHNAFLPFQNSEFDALLSVALLDDCERAVTNPGYGKIS